MNNRVRIKNRIIGDGYPCYIIAEMSANHAGDIGRALEIIHAARDAGADCVKIQTYTADTLTINCDNKYFRIQSGTWAGENLYSLYQKAYTPWEWQEQLKIETEKLGMDFLSTPFDSTSVDFLEKINVNFYKIASFEIVDIPLIKYVASKGKPIIMSTGMASFDEIKEAVNTVREQGNPNLCLLKCSSAYPAIPHDMNLKTIIDLAEKFSIPIGLSDHTLSSVSAITAVALGAKIIEKHFCISRKIKNPDASFSMEHNEFKQMVCDIRDAEQALGKISYEVSEYEKASKSFRKSIFVTANIKKGEIFKPENIRVIRPAYGLPPKYYESILGKRASRDIERGEPLEWDLIIESGDIHD